jgi:hypothetical protein
MSPNMFDGVWKGLVVLFIIAIVCAVGFGMLVGWLIS